MIEQRKLLDGGTLTYDAAFFDQAEADRLLDLLKKDVLWQHEVGRGRPFPRLTAWYADTGVNYSYSGVTHQGKGWTPELLQVKQRVEAAAGVPFNSLLLNLYRDGRDSIGFHTDAEPELGQDPMIASVSLGAVRRFILKHKNKREKLSYALAHGSLLVMGGTSQHYWVHGVPKTVADVGPRINLTFRQILEGPTGRNS